jgi:polyisoprenyl-teichoic acid--peptidoglycan teichoic acid transferase
MKKFLKYFSIVFVGVLIICLAIGVKVYKDIEKAAEAIYTPISEGGEEPPVMEKIQKKESVSILILGVDERENDRGRSDTMIVMTINPSDNTSKMVSIPRDTYTDIIGYGMKDKINHAYAYGGIKMSKETVEALLDIDIDYVSKINMEGFKQLIDIVGPISVDNKLKFSYGGSNFPIGKLSLNGKQAMDYVQMRKSDPDGDFGRQNRQKQVIHGMIQEALSFNAVLNYNDILKVMTEHVQANLTLDDMIKLQKEYKNSLGEIEQLSLAKGSPKYINGIYYFVLDDHQLASVQKTLQNHLK